MNVMYVVDGGRKWFLRTSQTDREGRSITARRVSQPTLDSTFPRYSYAIDSTHAFCALVAPVETWEESCHFCHLLTFCHPCHDDKLVMFPPWLHMARAWDFAGSVPPGVRHSSVLKRISFGFVFSSLSRLQIERD